MRLPAHICLAAILIGFLSCTERDPIGPSGGTTGGDPEVDPTLVFSEHFDKCTLSDGPAIQSDDFRNDCENPLSHIDFKSSVWKTVGSSHVCDDSYIESRGFADWVYLFRVKERRGYISCGENSEGKRGIIQSPMLEKIDSIADISVSFRVKPSESMTDALEFKVVLSGVITSASLNGVNFPVTTAHRGIEHSLVIPRESMMGGWNKVTVEVASASSGTMLYWAGASSDKSLNHGFCLDDIEVRTVKPMTRAGSRNLRLLFWNIQNGMWSDQTAEFANFREFVRKYNPDVCVWCEAQSIYKDRSTTAVAPEDRHFPAAWPEFAASYGHSYTALGGYRIYADDYYPQVITSRYPIRTLASITETDDVHQAMADKWTDGASHASEYHAACGEDYCPVAHGAAVQQIEVGGVKVNIVTLHLWPHAYSYYAKYVSKQTSDPQSVGGNAQRLAEIKYICSRSIADPALAGETNWLMMGDFNTRSRLDNWFYGLDEGSALLSSHDYILNETSYKDVIAETWPDQFFATRTWANDAGGKVPPRYDFVYASPQMMSKVRNAVVLNEKWTNMVWAMSNYYDTSDHRPILIDFDLGK